MKHSGIACLGLGALLLGGCGFTIPNETQVKGALPELNVTGSCRSPYFRAVTAKLRLAGVKVHTGCETTDPLSKDPQVPSLTVPEPGVSVPLMSVNAYQGAIEYNMIVSTASVLTVPGHRPILMRNAITRAYMNKSGRALATANEFESMLNETYDELARQLMIRLSYLGRQSDPGSKVPQPSELTESSDDPSSKVTDQLPAGMSLMDALRYQAEQEQKDAQSVTLEELQNAPSILDHRYELPKTAPKMRNEAPENVSDEGF
ncbi:MAG: hypothetical protein SPL30_08970 [Succinivibrio sp.]|jgi:outer membrane lipopolysaccharide assembly protein LptE/RlpB|nr:hypothetical protein [Succinivibrio sp.]